MPGEVAYTDSYERLERLVANLAPKFRDRFLAVIRTIQSRTTLDELEELVRRGDVGQALIGAEQAIQPLVRNWQEAFQFSGLQTAQRISAAADELLSFNSIGPRAVAVLQRNGLRLVRGLSAEQRTTMLDVLQRGIMDARNPREVARELRSSLGLTPKQVAAVANYRRLLREQSSEALRRALRDRRFDARVLGDEPIPADVVDRMVARYRERMLAYRAETIARTEMLAAVNEANNEGLLQAAEANLIDPRTITQGWVVTQDGRQRDSHDFMAGQLQPLGRPFNSGLGNLLRFPGDPDAPAEDRANCRCGLTTRASLTSSAVATIRL